MPQNASCLYDELIKFSSQYSPCSDVTFGENGEDDGGINRHRECKSDEIDQPYQHQSGDSAKYAEATIKMDEKSAYQPRKIIQHSH